MILNENCIYDVLTYFRDNLSFFTRVSNADSPANAFILNSVKFLDCIEGLSDVYAVDEIKYAIIKLQELGFVKCYGQKNDITEDGVEDITVKGHRFLEKHKAAPSFSIFD